MPKFPKNIAIVVKNVAIVEKNIVIVEKQRKFYNLKLLH